MYLYSDDIWMCLNITCNRKLKKCKELKRERTSVQIYTDRKFITILGWQKDKSWHEVKPIFSVKVPYIKNNKYEIKYRFEKENIAETHTFPFSSDDIVEITCGQLTVIKQIHPARAKKEFKKLQEDGLIGKVHYDSWSDFYDIFCKACHHPDDDNYECLSNPTYGRVYELKEPPKLTEMREVFRYNNKWYKKIPEKNWYILSWYNKNQYNAKKKYYYDHGLIEKDDGTIDKKMLEKHNEDWPPFEDFWKKEPKHYYRNLKTGEVLSEYDDKFNPAGMEQVVTKGWHSDHPAGSVHCPVCERMHKLTSAGDFWYPKLGYKFLCAKWRIENAIRRIKVIIENKKYDFKNHRHSS